MSRKINILVLYTWEDKDSKPHLLQHLDQKIHDLNATIWHEDPINPKQAGNTYFESRLHHADLILLLISQHFLNSKFIKKSAFKAIIDSHKQSKSMVVPVILQSCNWDTDLKFIDYIFNLRELEVLPENERPLLEWESEAQAYENVANSLEKSIRLYIDERPGKTLNEENQTAMRFSEEKENTDTIEEPSPERELSEEEKHKLWREAEAKRRAEVARRIKEQAEESARQREEEDRLWEEAMAKRRAEKERRILEEVAASASTGTSTPSLSNDVVEQERIRNKELAARQRADERRQKKEAAEAKRRAAKEQKIKDAAAEAQRRRARKQNFVQQSETNPSAIHEDVTTASSELETTAEDEPFVIGNILNKKVIIGTLIGLLVIAAGWFITNQGNEIISTENATPSNEAEATVLPPEDPAPKTTKEATTKSLPTLEVGELYNGGIVFSVKDSGQKGTIAHTEDAGLMSWQAAAKIHERLGEGWRLPTFEELELMYQTIGPGGGNKGEFSSELYWSATDFDEFQARLIRFWDGNTSYHYNKHVESRQFQVRAVKDFER